MIHGTRPRVVSFGRAYAEARQIAIEAVKYLGLLPPSVGRSQETTVLSENAIYPNGPWFYVARMLLKPGDLGEPAGLASAGWPALSMAAPHRRIDSSVLPLRGKGMLRKPLAGLRT